MTGKRLNTEEKERIEDLSAEGLTPNRIAGQLRRSPHTVQKHIESPDAQTRIAEKLEVVAERVIDSFSPADYKKAGLVAKLTAAGIAVDKLRLIKGQATQINISVLLDAVQAAKEYQAARAEEAMQAVRRRIWRPAKGDKTRRYRVFDERRLHHPFGMRTLMNFNKPRNSTH